MQSVRPPAATQRCKLLFTVYVDSSYFPSKHVASHACVRATRSRDGEAAWFVYFPVRTVDDLVSGLGTVFRLGSIADACRRGVGTRTVWERGSRSHRGFTGHRQKSPKPASGDRGPDRHLRGRSIPEAESISRGSMHFCAVALGATRRSLRCCSARPCLPARRGFSATARNVREWRQSRLCRHLGRVAFPQIELHVHRERNVRTQLPISVLLFGPHGPIQRPLARRLDPVKVHRQRAFHLWLGDDHRGRRRAGHPVEPADPTEIAQVPGQRPVVVVRADDLDVHVVAVGMGGGDLLHAIHNRQDVPVVWT